MPAGGGVHVGGGGGRGPGNGFYPHHYGNRYGNGSYWLPWYSPWWDDDGSYQNEAAQQPQSPPAPQVIVVRSEEPRAPVGPPPSPKLIEVPQAKDAPAPKPQPAAMFVLKDGARLESRSYLITSQLLQVDIGMEQRTIPLSSVDLEATVAANQERGIKLLIPRNANTLFIGF